MVAGSQIPALLKRMTLPIITSSPAAPAPAPMPPSQTPTPSAPIPAPADAAPSSPAASSEAPATPTTATTAAAATTASFDLDQLGVGLIGWFRQIAAARRNRGRDSGRQRFTWTCKACGGSGHNGQPEDMKQKFAPLHGHSPVWLCLTPTTNFLELRNVPDREKFCCAGGTDAPCLRSGTSQCGFCGEMDRRGADGSLDFGAAARAGNLFSFRRSLFDERSSERRTSTSSATQKLRLQPHSWRSHHEDRKALAFRSGSDPRRISGVAKLVSGILVGAGQSFTDSRTTTALASGALLSIGCRRPVAGGDVRGRQLRGSYVARAKAGCVPQSAPLVPGHLQRRRPCELIAPDQIAYAITHHVLADDADRRVTDGPLDLPGLHFVGRSTSSALKFLFHQPFLLFPV
jgi:hypothetical protein